MGDTMHIMGNKTGKRDEGMRTPLWDRTESLSLLREDRFPSGPGRRQGYDGSARYSRGYRLIPAKRFRVFPRTKRSGTTGSLLVFVVGGASSLYHIRYVFCLFFRFAHIELLLQFGKVRCLAFSWFVI